MLRSAAVFGVDAYPVDIEVDVSFGLPELLQAKLLPPEPSQPTFHRDTAYPQFAQFRSKLGHSRDLHSITHLLTTWRKDTT